MPHWLWFLGAAGVAVAAPAVVVGEMARRALYPARALPSDSPRLATPIREVRFAERAGGRRGWLLLPSGTPRGAVLLVHGWERDASQLLSCADFLAARGWAGLVFDLRGHGRSGGGGPVLLPHLAEDARAALALLDEDLRVPGPRVGLGISIGAAALVLARRDGARLDGLALAATFARFATLARALLVRRKLPAEVLVPAVLAAWNRAAGGRLSALDPAELIEGVNVPLLLAHGTEDRVVPVRDFRELRRAAPETVTTALEIPGGGHGDLCDNPEFRDALGRFLSRFEFLSPITG